MEGMEKQLTAIDWLLENLITEPFSEAHFEHNSNCWDKAKEMENKQRHFAYQDGREDVFDWLKKMDYDFLVEEINKSE
jgi:hypothetical protein